MVIVSVLLMVLWWFGTVARSIRRAVGLLGVMPVLLLVGEAGGLACWGVGVVFGNRIVDASIFACPCCQ